MSSLKSSVTRIKKTLTGASAQAFWGERQQDSAAYGITIKNLNSGQAFVDAKENITLIYHEIPASAVHNFVVSSLGGILTMAGLMSILI